MAAIAVAHSLERVGQLTQQAVATLQRLQQLAALTLITTADLGDGHHAGLHHQPPWELQGPVLWDAAEAAAAAAAVGVGAAAGAPGAMAAAAAAAAAAFEAAPDAARAGMQGRDGLWLPLLLVPCLQEVVVGSVWRGQTLALTTTLTSQLQPPSAEQLAGGCAGSAARPPGQQQQQLGLVGRTGGSNSWFLQGVGGQRYEHQEGAAVCAYICPEQWSSLAAMQVRG